MSRRVLVTGGAGFVGSALCLRLAERHPDWHVVAGDNLHRRGSELNLPRLRAAGVSFAHLDVRRGDELARAGDVDAIVECSAEPSVMAAVDGAADYVVETNLLGAHRCLEHAARHGAQVVFLSTSRVYPLRHLLALELETTDERFVLRDEQPMPGASAWGVSETFPLDGARTLYGTTKLAAEMLVAEAAETHGLRVSVLRSGVVAGPWQMGKVDQGVFTHWMLSHVLDRPLSYIGFGGEGRQVRDLLHVEDLVALVERQLLDPTHWAGTTFNVGGGPDGSLSLRETTALCREISGRRVEVGADPETRAGDVPHYVSDARALLAHDDWRPARTPGDVLHDVHRWIVDHEDLVRRLG